MIIFWATLCNGCASDGNSSLECDGILTQVGVTADRIGNMQWVPAFVGRNPAIYFFNSAKAPFQSSGGGLF